ncbi:MAG: YtxH domain-containing protein [Acidobacteriota bacterium]
MKKETGQILWATSLGVLAGGVTALLLAPASGKDTRQKLARGYQRLKERSRGSALALTEKPGRDHEVVPGPVPKAAESRPL